MLWDLSSGGEFSFFVDILALYWCLYYPMSEYVTLLILAMMTASTIAAGSRLNTENSFEFCYWNEFNQMRFTFECMWNVGAVICHHCFSWLSHLDHLKIHCKYQIQKWMVRNAECNRLGRAVLFLEWNQEVLSWGRQCAEWRGGYSR